MQEVHTPTLEHHDWSRSHANIYEDHQSHHPCAPEQERDLLMATMPGSKVKIPDLQKMVQHWPQGVHPEIDDLDEDVKKTLSDILGGPGDEKRLKTMMKSGVALFGASWWPYTSLERLCIATYLSIWLFVWDDETDSLEYSPLINNFNQSCSFRAETTSYIDASLRMADDAELDSISTNPIITNFRPVGEAIARTCNDRQVETFKEELHFFIKMSEEEQMFQMTPHLPSVEEYTRRRMGSSAVRVCLAITEYAYGTGLPRHIMEDDDMKAIWDETNIIISTTNDILSIKKEVAQSQVDTLIPLLTIRLGSAQEAISCASEIVQASIRRFEIAERALLKRYGGNSEVREALQKFIDGSKYACTANLNWSLVSGRYRLNCKSMKGGLAVTL